MGVHDNHRDRMKHRYLTEGASAFDDRQLLELYLFYSIPRKDVSPLANLLIERFGSLSAVLDAPVKELTAVPGIGEHTAISLHLIRDLARRSMMSGRPESGAVITDWQSAEEYLLPCFYGARVEQIRLLCLDTRGLVLYCGQLGGDGGAAGAALSLPELTETAQRHHAASVILAHNHPGGNPKPSREDLDATARARTALEAVQIALLDHLILGDGVSVSLRREAPALFSPPQDAASKTEE